MKRLTNDGRSLNPVWGPRYIAYDRERLRRNDAPLYQIWLRAPGGGGARGGSPTCRSGSSSRVWCRSPSPPTAAGCWPSSRARTRAKRGPCSVPSGRAHRMLVHGGRVMAAGISRDGSTVLVDEGAFEGPPSGGRVAGSRSPAGARRCSIAHGSQASWNG